MQIENHIFNLHDFAFLLFYLVDYQCFKTFLVIVFFAKKAQISNIFLNFTDLFDFFVYF